MEWKNCVQLWALLRQMAQWHSQFLLSAFLTAPWRATQKQAVLVLWARVLSLEGWSAFCPSCQLQLTALLHTRSAPATRTLYSLNPPGSLLPQCFGMSCSFRLEMLFFTRSTSVSLEFWLNYPFFNKTFPEQPLQSSPLSYHPIFLLPLYEIIFSGSSFSHLLTDLVTMPPSHFLVPEH